MLNIRFLFCTFLLLKISNAQGPVTIGVPISPPAEDAWLTGLYDFLNKYEFSLPEGWKITNGIRLVAIEKYYHQVWFYTVGIEAEACEIGNSGEIEPICFDVLIQDRTFMVKHGQKVYPSYTLVTTKEQFVTTTPEFFVLLVDTVYRPRFDLRETLKHKLEYFCMLDMKNSPGEITSANTELLGELTELAVKSIKTTVDLVISGEASYYKTRSKPNFSAAVLLLKFSTPAPLLSTIFIGFIFDTESNGVIKEDIDVRYKVYESHLAGLRLPTWGPIQENEKEQFRVELSTNANGLQSKNMKILDIAKLEIVSNCTDVVLPEIQEIQEIVTFYVLVCRRWRPAFISRIKYLGKYIYSKHTAFESYDYAIESLYANIHGTMLWKVYDEHDSQCPIESSTLGLLEEKVKNAMEKFRLWFSDLKHRLLFWTPLFDEELKTYLLVYSVGKKWPPASANAETCVTVLLPPNEADARAYVENSMLMPQILMRTKDKTLEMMENYRI